MKRAASGTFVVRLPPALHAALREEAARAGLSLNALCTRALEGFLLPAPSTARAIDENEPSWMQNVRKLYGESVRGIVLFGSVARGESRDDSDVDLLIVVDRNLPLTRRLYSLWDDLLPGDKHSPSFVHLPLRAEQAGSLWLEAAVDGIVLMDADGDVSRALGRIRRLIASGTRKRLSAYGHPYWVDAQGAHGDVQ